MTRAQPDLGQQLRAKLTVVAAMVGMGSQDFGVGWADGVSRWKRRRDVVEPCRHPEGSVLRAASEAAVTFMRERNG